MTKDRYVLWTDINLNFDDWKDDLLSEYPELSENELIEKMYEVNADYLDDERVNLNRQLITAYPYNRRFGIMERSSKRLQND